MSKIDQKGAEQSLVVLVQKRDLVYEQWAKRKFVALKIATPTEKGDIGEDFLAGMLKAAGFGNISVVSGRRGPYDVRAVLGGKEMLVEVKVATRDVHKHFQFNGVRYDTAYTHLFCLGIGPDKIGYILLTKSELHDHHLVPMAKGVNSTFKLTKKEEQLSSFELFEQDINAAFAALQPMKVKGAKSPKR